MSMDRCAVSFCRTSVDLDWNAYGCPGGHVVVCEHCDWREACDECVQAEAAAEAQHVAERLTVGLEAVHANARSQTPQPAPKKPEPVDLRHPRFDVTLYLNPYFQPLSCGTCRRLIATGERCVVVDNHDIFAWRRPHYHPECAVIA